jgi:LuxR family maltose regulon positive regulatory protein
MARVQEARGDLDAALELLSEAQPVFMIDLSPNLRPSAAMKARILIRQGRTDEALSWARDQRLSVEDDLSYAHEDDLSYAHEYEHITLVRALLVSGSAVQASALLKRLLQAAERGGRTGSMIEILVLQALANDVGGDSRAALVPLQRALTLAEPEGYIRVFVDEGSRMAALLDVAGKRGITPGYVQRLLTQFGPATAEPPTQQNLIEPLSERELDVLRLLATDLDGPEIASQLMVSLNTMRTHTKSIYTKLGVNSRRAAVHRAEQLQLLSLTPTR